MKTKAIKLLSFILALLMLVPLIASCGKGGTPPSNEAGADGNDSAIDYQAILGFGPEDNQDYKFTILVSDSDSYEHLSKELNSNFVNDAVFKRNIAVEEFFKIKLNVIETPGNYFDRANFKKVVEGPIISGQHEHDLVVGVMGAIANIEPTTLFLPVQDIEYIDLDKEWWVANQFEDLSVEGKLFTLFGDMNLTLYSEIHTFIFNEQMISNNSLVSPYQRIKDNTWIYSNVVKDSIIVGSGDGDEVIELEEDTFGMIGTVNPQRALKTGFNLSILQRNPSTGQWFFPSALDQTYINAYMMVYDAFMSHEYNSFQEAEDDDYTESLTAMAQDRCLYLPSYNHFITNPILTGMEGDFGVVPYPKLNADQSRYYCQVATGSTCTLFPKTLTDTTLSAKVATYMSYVGSEMVAKPYFDNYLKERLARSPAMQEMLDLVRDSAVISADSYYPFGLLTLFEVSYVEYNQFGTGISDEYTRRFQGLKSDLKKLRHAYMTS